METQIKKNVLWSLLIIVALMSLSCRSGAKVPEYVSITNPDGILIEFVQLEPL